MLLLHCSVLDYHRLDAFLMCNNQVKTVETYNKQCGRRVRPTQYAPACL